MSARALAAFAVLAVHVLPLLASAQNARDLEAQVREVEQLLAPVSLARPMSDADAANAYTAELERQAALARAVADEATQALQAATTRASRARLLNLRARVFEALARVFDETVAALPPWLSQPATRTLRRNLSEQVRHLRCLADRDRRGSGPDTAASRSAPSTPHASDAHCVDVPQYGSRRTPTQ